MASVLSLKVGVLSFSVICVAMVLKLSLPAVTEFANSELPSSIWSIVMTWLRPPYLYVVINGIIIIIVASSKLQNRKAYVVDETLAVPPVPVAVVYGGTKGAPEVDISLGYDANLVKVPDQYDVYSVVLPEEETKVMTSAVSPVIRPEHDVYSVVLPEEETKVMTSAVSSEIEGMMMMTTATLDANATDGMIPEDDVAISGSLRTLESNSSDFPVSMYEKPPVSVRIGQRKAVKPEGGRALGVSKPKRQETLETTWKTITEGRPMPLNRHLRKSDTWETHGNHHLPQEPDPKMTKSETFHDHTSTDPSDGHVGNTAGPLPGLGRLRKEPSGSWKLKKDPSLSQEELNWRVEAFINKFNEDMRLQRQESLNRYTEMISRGAH